MTDEAIRSWLDPCKENRPDWWDQIKHLPTDLDKLDALVMIALREFGETPPHLRN